VCSSDLMRARLNVSATPSAESLAAQADRELELERARSAADDLLARYKRAVESDESLVSGAPARQPVSAVPPGSGPEPRKDDEGPDEAKTLGRTEGPIRPID